MLFICPNVSKPSAKGFMNNTGFIGNPDPSAALVEGEAFVNTLNDTKYLDLDN